MDGTARSVIYRGSPPRQHREPLVQRHYLARTDTGRHGLEATHDPKRV